MFLADEKIALKHEKFEIFHLDYDAKEYENLHCIFILHFISVLVDFRVLKARKFSIYFNQFYFICYKKDYYEPNISSNNSSHPISSSR